MKPVILDNTSHATTRHIYDHFSVRKGDILIAKAVIYFKGCNLLNISIPEYEIFSNKSI